MEPTLPKIEQIASEVVLLAPDDAASRLRIEKLIREIALADTTPPAVSELAWQALVVVQGLVQAANPDAALKRLGDLLEAMVKAEAAPPPDPVADVEVTSAPAPAADTETAVDDPLIHEFLVSQESSLQDFEAACLELTAGDVTAPLAFLRRQIHTWKGEAGILGLKPLAAAMHEIEEALGASDLLPPDVVSDAMLQLGDSVGAYFRALHAGQAADFVVAPVLQLLQPALAATAASAPPPASPAKPAPAAPTAPAVGGMRFDMPAEIDMDLLQEFRTESVEHFQLAEAALLALESNPSDSEAVNVVFRAFHTVKGVAGFVGISCVTDLAHKAETFFDRFRKGQLVLQGAYTDLAFEALDLLKVLLGVLDTAVAVGYIDLPPTYGDLIRRLEQPETAAAASPTAARERSAPATNDVDATETTATEPQTAAAPRTAQSGGTEADATIKVSTARLDNLINMVGELVIAQLMVSQDPALAELSNPRLVRNVSQLSKITRALQELALSMRMVSVRATFQKMSRLVRDLARKSGKEILLETEGEDTELDRNMVEAIADPLVHMVRNSADHGIESPDERVRQGKPRQGRIFLRAAHEGGSVVITLADDGRGLNTEKIIAKAVERGLVEPGVNLSDAEIQRLIFLPGFSTADKVTDVSGRGVGMDVVRTNIEALRGTIGINSRPGEGSTFSFRLPLTLAIIDGMVIRVGGERFILPIIAITETFRPRPEDITTVQGESELVMLRGSLLPVCRLGTHLGVTDAGTELTDSILVVVESKDRRLALMVDELLGQQQVVIKSLGKLFGNVEGVNGGAILGDGRVRLILDVEGLMTLSDKR